MDMVKLLEVSVAKTMCLKLRVPDQGFALVRTTRATHDLLLYRILLTPEYRPLSSA
jgi:hypothetical protein